MAIGPFAIEQIFDKIWESWLNKDGEASARKAVTVYFKSDGSKEELIRACETYVLENIQQDPAFTYKLSNFINQDHWRDMLERTSHDRLKKKEALAYEIIDAWNRACKPHWCQIADRRARLPIAMSALNDSFFAENWKKALTKAESIFKFEHREGDSRSKIILSFSWFTNVTPNKHTVVKILEGEFGKPQADSQAPKLVKMNPDPAPQEVKDEIAEEWRKMHKEFQEKMGIVPAKKIVRKPKPNEPNKKTKAAIEKMLKSFGIPIEETDKDDDIIDII